MGRSKNVGEVQVGGSEREGKEQRPQVKDVPPGFWSCPSTGVWLTMSHNNSVVLPPQTSGNSTLNGINSLGCNRELDRIESMLQGVTFEGLVTQRGVHFVKIHGADLPWLVPFSAQLLDLSSKCCGLNGCAPPTKFTCWNPSAQCNGVSGRSFGR